jgi:hypothetical protein
VILTVLTALLAIVPLPAPSVEKFYARGFYPRLQPLMTTASGVTSIAWLDIAVVLLLVVLVVVFVRAARSGGWKAGARTLAVLALHLTAIGYLLFLVVWGLNYRRMTLEEKLGFDRSRVTSQAAVTLASEAARQLNALHAQAHATPFNREALGAAFQNAERATGASRYTLLGAPKRSALGLYMRQAAFDGMTNPLFLEVILNPDLLEFEKPETLAHEWGHLAGYARESEASFLAWITCLNGDPLAQYSGWLSAYSRAFHALPRMGRSSLPRLDQGPRDDYAAISRRFRRSSPVVRGAAREVYDSYLKANRIQEGIANYDSVLQLMLGTELGESWKRSLPAK